MANDSNPQRNSRLVTDVDVCPRCGLSHRNVRFIGLNGLCDKYEVRLWGECPNYDEPIIMSVRMS